MRRTSIRSSAMERTTFFRRHAVLIRCAALSFAGHLIFLVLFQVAAIHQKPLPRHLQFTLLSIPHLWEGTSPLAEATSDLRRADTSLLELVETPNVAPHPQLELLHRQFIWEEEPEGMSAATSSLGTKDWVFKKEHVDYRFLLGFLQDTPKFIAGGPARRLPLQGEIEGPAPNTTERIVLSATLRQRGLIEGAVPEVPLPESALFRPALTRLDVAVDSSGAVRHTLVLRGSGDPRLDAMARKAVKSWKFSPRPEMQGEPLLWGWVELRPAVQGRERDGIVSREEAARSQKEAKK